MLAKKAYEIGQNLSESMYFIKIKTIKIVFVPSIHKNYHNL